jgi:hypothetical protein
MEEAQERIFEMVGAECYDATKRYHFEVSSNDQLLRTLIHDKDNSQSSEKEAFQLLHSVYVAGASKGIMVIGSREKFMYSVEVQYTQELLNAFGVVLDYIYEQHFKSFYEDSVNAFLEKKQEEIEQALEYIDHLDFHSLMSTYMLWRALNVDVMASNIWFPLPPTTRIIPYKNAFWNVLKGPSDTTTKLVDKVEEQLGIRTPRTIATARLMSVASVALHRSFQMQTCKADMQRSYGSLFAYRDAAKHRFPLVRSLTELLKYNKIGLKRLEAANTLILSRNPVLVAPDNTPPRRPTRAAAEEKVDRVSWGFYESIGCTPCKGRSSNEGHRRRELACNGIALICRSDTSKGKCSLCGTTTAMYCTGCKNWLCFAGMTEKKAQDIIKLKKDDSVSELPALLIKHKYVDEKTGEWKTAWTAKNNCYSIKHRAAFDRVWSAKRSAEDAEPMECGDEEQLSIDTS